MIYKFLALLTYLFTVYISFTMPIGPSEARYMYEEFSAVQILMQLSASYPRLPFLLIATVNFFLFYKLTQYYLHRQKDRGIALAIFVLLPGIISSAILSDQSSLGIFATLLFLLAYKKGVKLVQVLSLILLLLVHKASIILFLAILIYASYSKKLYLLLTSLILLTVGFYLHGFDVSGKPSGYFLELFALYALVFSPFLFLYFLFAIYRQGVIDKNRDILLFVSAISLVLSFVLSIRQYIHIEDFAPFVVIAVILMVDTFSKSYHVRLRPFRKRYKVAFFLILSSLIINSFVLLNHKWLFYIKDPQVHFAYNFYQPYALAKKLKDQGITCIDAQSQRLQNQLRFYEIDRCNEYILHTKEDKSDKKLEIYYKEVYFETLHVSKVNTF